MCECHDTDRCVYNLTPKGLAVLAELDKIADEYALPVEALLADQGALDAARAEARRRVPELFEGGEAQ